MDTQLDLFDTRKNKKIQGPKRLLEIKAAIVRLEEKRADLKNEVEDSEHRIKIGRTPRDRITEENSDIRAKKSEMLRCAKEITDLTTEMAEIVQLYNEDLTR